MKNQTALFLRFFSTGFFLYLILFVAGCRTFISSNQSDDVFVIAEGYVALNEPDVAGSLYRKILQKRPNDGRAFLGLARIALKSGDYHTALRELDNAEQGFFLTEKEKESIQILFGRTYFQMNKPPLIVWSYLYPVWEKGDLATKSSLDRELKELARKLPSNAKGVNAVLGFVPKPAKLVYKAPPPRFIPRPKHNYNKKTYNHFILTRSKWRPLYSPNLKKLKPMGKPYRITIHHSDHDSLSLPQGQNDSAEVIRNIQRYHMKKRGWGDIAYHFIIDTSGRIWTARPIQYQGAHAGSGNNGGNIGICLLGNFDIHRPTSQQVNSLKWLVNWLEHIFNISKSQVFGHSHFKATKCPGKYLLPIVKQLRKS